MKRIKPFILPAAILLGLLLHRYAALATPVVPYIIFTILLLNFSAVDLLKLKINRLDMAIMMFQTVVSIGGYGLLRFLAVNTAIAEGWLIAVMCPVASSVVVVAAALGADRRTTTGYTIYGNLLVSVIAPLMFALIGHHPEVQPIDLVANIFCKVASVIALPFFIALALQKFLPKVTAGISRFREWAFPLWAIALLLTLGQTIDYIFLYYRGNEGTIIWLAVIGAAICALQFWCGKRIGARYGETVAGGQMLGQKNSAMGIWMASLYLTPLSSVILAFYSIYQNLFNSWQIWRKEHSGKSNDVNTR